MAKLRLLLLISKTRKIKFQLKRKVLCKKLSRGNNIKKCLEWAQKMLAKRRQESKLTNR